MAIRVFKLFLLSSVFTLVFLCIFAVIIINNQKNKQMRNKPLSKSTLCISLLMLVCTSFPQRAVGQPAVNYALNYNSLDIATPNQYIASGGEFWCIKDASTLINPNNCYRTETIAVKPIDHVNWISTIGRPSPLSINTNYILPSSQTYYEPIANPCVTP